MKTMIRACLIAGAAGTVCALAACSDSGDVKDVTPRKVDPNAPKIDPDAGPGGGFTPMEDTGASGGNKGGN